MMRAGDYEREDSGLLLRRRGIERAHPQWMCGPAFFGGAASPSTDPNFANVVALMHLDSGGTSTFTDQKGHSFTTLGGSANSATQSKFGGASLFVSSGLVSTASADWDMGTGDFTIEGWAWNGSSVTTLQLLVCNRTGAGSDRGPLVLVQSGQIRAFCGDASGTILGDTGLVGALSLNTWFHWAYCRSGTSFRLFVNGAQGGSTITSSSACGGGQALQIGYDPGTTGRAWLGYIDDFRYTKGVGRYTSNFSVPTAAFPNS